MDSRCRLYLGDCARLSEYFSKAAVLLVDPPYRDWVHAKATSVTKARGAFRSTPCTGTRHRDLGFSSLTPALMATIVDAASRVQRWSVIYSDVESTHLWREAILSRGTEYVRGVPWVRWSMPNLQGDRPPQGCEMLSVFHPKGRKRWNGPGNLVALEHLTVRAEGKHQTEKPLDQALDLVSWFSDPGELVLDLTAGRGTTAVACVLLGRRFVGAELDPVEYAKAFERIRNASRGILSARDTDRVRRYCEAVAAESSVTLTPKAKKRLARRRKDAARLAQFAGKKAA